MDEEVNATLREPLVGGASPRSESPVLDDHPVSKRQVSFKNNGGGADRCFDDVVEIASPMQTSFYLQVYVHLSAPLFIYCKGL